MEIPNPPKSANTKTLDILLRIFENSPAIGAPELSKWLSDVVRIFWTLKPRDIDCAELDELYGRAGGVGMNVDSQEVSLGVVDAV